MTFDFSRCSASQRDSILRAAAAVAFHLVSLHEIIKEISPACCIRGQMRRDTRHNPAVSDRFGVIINHMGTAVVILHRNIAQQ